MKVRPECKSCIDEFAVRRKMTLLADSLLADTVGSDIHICMHHDMPVPGLTIAALDPAGVMA